MDRFVQTLAGVLVAVLIGIAVSKQGKDITLGLSVAVCCMVLAVMISYLEPVVDFIRELQTMGSLDGDMVQILLKAVGISILAEIAALVCADSGNGALGKSIQLLAVGAVLWLSLPLLRALLEMVQKMMGEI